MTATETLLVELLTEELPPKALARLGQTFAETIVNSLRKSGFLNAQSGSESFATPRRLAVAIEGVAARSADREAEVKLMPLAVAFDASGAPSAALNKKLAARGIASYEAIDPAALSRRMDGKAETLFLTEIISGKPLAQGLQSALVAAVSSLPIPKVMSYQLADGLTTVEFVRPAHRLLALWGSEVVEVSILGLKADRLSSGHRFQGARDIRLDHADDYVAKLSQEGQVTVSFAQRQAAIEEALLAAARAQGGSLGDAASYSELLDEVTALVEQPAVYVGEFEESFLAVPQECLILTMRQNQKYFPLFDHQGRLQRRFLIVSNMRLADPDNIVRGNERVVRPRLADARFFFEQDRKTPLAARVDKLASVVYHNKLGTQLERTERLERLAGALAVLTGADAAAAGRAARLAKADLVTDMVGEFPELQGIMGRYYACHDGEQQAVAEAIEQHYWPRFAGDRLPQGGVAVAVALADKLDTLLGIFGIGLAPTGDKDPFGLRRHAVGVLRILMETPVRTPLSVLLERARQSFGARAAPPESAAAVAAFMLERLKNYLKEREYAAQDIEAVLAVCDETIYQVPRRLEAVRQFNARPEAQALAAANKRIANILAKEAGADSAALGRGAAGAAPDPTRFEEDAERALFAAGERLRPQVEAWLAEEDFTAALIALAGLRAEVDRFFTDVMVMAEDPGVRENRLRLLKHLGAMMNRVADLSKLA
ncbi:MAG: glycine--tRNA ligase subunit beta [Betaproteobacteria bacterium]|nr:glycine--tRNA ligase subunit beta [Betaproteobacteria bacterium]